MTREVHTDEYDGPDRRSNEWHLDKKVSISVIGLLIVNICSSIWWAATLTSEVDELKRRPELSERVIRLEATVDEHSRVLNKLTAVLDKLDVTIDKIATEQAKRSSRIDRLEDYMRTHK